MPRSLPSGSPARRTIDAAGLVVAPGFIDLHAHGQIPETYRFRSLDGVTTALELEVGTGDVDDVVPGATGRRADQLRRQHRTHSGSDGGCSTIPARSFPTGDAAHRAASPAEVTDIARRIESGLEQGAVSIGAGFPYTPAATREELLDVFRIAGRHHVPVHVHIRSGVAGLEEALDLAARTKAPLHVVHINSSATSATREMLQMIADARRRGQDVTTEAYPYTAGMTEIQSANLDSYQDGPDERLALLEWPRTGERLNRETFEKYRRMGGPVILHSNTEEMVAAAIDSPLTMIASDAYWENGTGHPRTTGTYSKVLGRYVREAGSLTLMDAIRKMTLMPAQRLQARVPAMKAKGRLRVGADADITIFDAARIIDRSTYREPTIPPAGHSARDCERRAGRRERPGGGKGHAGARGSCAGARPLKHCRGRSTQESRPGRHQRLAWLFLTAMSFRVCCSTRCGRSC